MSDIFQAETLSDFFYFMEVIMKSLKTLATLIVLAFFVGIAPAFAVTLSLTDKGGGVITSYSIHYTKLYDSGIM